jgi:hypothetical protein
MRITSRTQATRRLGKLSEKHMVEQAAFDDSIDARVFGKEAAIHIEQARELYERGQYEQALHAVGRAKMTAVSSSCPNGMFGSENGEADQEDSKNISDLDCEFVSKKCPLCKKENVMTKVTKTHITGSCGCSKSK